jgi:hypothetical protein
MKNAKEMSIIELSNWFALCNALKFINQTSALRKQRVLEKDIDYRKILEYIEDAGGDIKTCIKATGGVPYKYSLSSTTEESWEIEDLDYEFLDTKYSF